jgi:hypothetical protein
MENKPNWGVICWSYNILEESSWSGKFYHWYKIIILVNKKKYQIIYIIRIYLIINFIFIVFYWLKYYLQFWINRYIFIIK